MHINYIILLLLNTSTDRQTNGQTDEQNDINTDIRQHCPDLRNDHVIFGHAIVGLQWK